VAIAYAVFAAACLLAAVQAPGAPAQSALDEFNEIQSELDSVESKEGVTTETISRYSGRIRDLQEEVNVLQEKRAALGARLDQVQAELDLATKRLEELRSHLERSIELLSDRLVDIYKSGKPDALTVALAADGFDQLVETGPYLQRINDMDSNIVGRVRDLRNEVETTVKQITAARDEIAAHKAEIDRTAEDLSSRKSELARARDEQEDVLDGLKEKHKKLEGDLEEASKEVAKELGSYASPLPAGAITPGQAGFIWPVTGSVTSGFGPRWGRMHEGIDIGVRAGTPIRAVKAGRIVIAGPTGGYGNYTCIDHGGGLSSCYAHQSSFAKTSGSIGQGEILGYVGCTGHCFGDHLHFEVRSNGSAIDPLNYL
jgi:murein DD-endopeptidase MepM/ murein hydrolase activator NlpD